MGKLKLRPLGDGCFEARRRTSWVVLASSPKSVDDLSFTSRDSAGRLCWWDVEPPRTDYWHAHQVLGRAYAFELLELLNQPEHDAPKHMLALIAEGMARSTRGTPGAREGMRHGFFEVLSEYLLTGTADR